MSTTEKKDTVVVPPQKQSKMETQFYEDHPNWIQKKKTMTLDLAPGVRTKKPITLLSTPDVNMLKLASPELEKLIVNQQGNVCTTPTPTQFICPKNVTDEQAAFAQGFVEALHNLHHITNGESTATDVETQGVNVQYFTQPTGVVSRAPPNTVVTSTQAFNPAHTTTTLPGAPAVSMAYSNSLPTSTVHAASVSVINNPQGWRHIKQEEPEQTVPVYHATPPMSPIDMDTQERIKSERKRLRNRIAASKCRKRKLERISRLEDKVNELKSQNQDLQTAATKLREQVCRLKQNVMEHVKSGCQVMLAQQLAF